MRISPNSPIIAFAGGGTGGHLYPAIAIAGAMREICPSVRIVFFGTQRPIDAQILEGTDYELVRQTLRPVSTVPWRWPGLWAAYRRSCRLCRERFMAQRPSVVVGTGGLGSFPAVREAGRMGIATALLNPDAKAGRANRHLAARVNVIYTQWPQASAHFRTGATVKVWGCPVRKAFSGASRRVGIERFGLDANRKTLLVTGASQGARTINEAAIAIAGFLRSLDAWQVLHLAGDADCERVRAAYREAGVAGRVLPFTDHMADALGAADLVVSRAGASTLAEIAEMARPAVLMPYPFHKDMHQLANARCLEAASAGVGVRIVEDAVDPAINGPALRDALAPLMTDENRRREMADALERIGRRNAAARIAEDLLAPAVRRKSASPCETLEPALL